MSFFMSSMSIATVESIRVDKKYTVTYHLNMSDFMIYHCTTLIIRHYSTITYYYRYASKSTSINVDSHTTLPYFSVEK